MFLAPKIFWAKAPEILDWRYKSGPSTDHRAKFYAARPMHLWDLALKKTSGLKLKSTQQAITSGRTKNGVTPNEGAKWEGV